MSTQFDITKIDEGLEEFPLFFPFTGKKGKQYHEPNKAMKKVHERFYGAIRAVASDNLIFSVGGSMGCSTYFNVWHHTYWGKRRHFYILDLHNAYSQMKTEDLVSVFCELHPSCPSAKLEKALKCYFMDKNDGLLRGAPASPDLFNMGLKPLDEDFLELCRRNGWEGTRYMDDICISAYDCFKSSERKSVRRVIENAGFELNHRKSRLLDINKKPIKITGLILDKDGRISVPRKYKAKLKAVLYKALQGDEKISEAKVRGRWGHFSYIHLRMGQCQRLTRDDREIVRMYGQYRRMIGKPLDETTLLGRKDSLVSKAEGNVRISFE